MYRLKPEDLYDNPLVFQNGSLVRCSCLPVAFEIVINENADNQDEKKSDKSTGVELADEIEYDIPLTFENETDNKITEVRKTVRKCTGLISHS